MLLDGMLLDGMPLDGMPLEPSAGPKLRLGGQSRVQCAGQLREGRVRHGAAERRGDPIPHKGTDEVSTDLPLQARRRDGAGRYEARRLAGIAGR